MLETNYTGKAFQSDSRSFSAGRSVSVLWLGVLGCWGAYSVPRRLQKLCCDAV